MLQVEYLGPGSGFRVPNANGNWTVYVPGTPAAMSEEQLASIRESHPEHRFVVHEAEAPAQKAASASPKSESMATAPEGTKQAE